jgi:2,4-dienoyl-CoA reductase-like NADH-dependent reductase (Old Yellow Enzyme family)
MLFDPLSLRSVTLRNRTGVSPMCMYSAEQGVVNDFHLAHLAARAMGGFGLIVTEATAVEARGRITDRCAGIWDDSHIEPWARATRLAKAHGAVIGVQLAHAGRKASCSAPFENGGPLTDARAWPTIGITSEPFDARFPASTAMDATIAKQVIDAFGHAAQRAVHAGFDLVEIHAAHGYLLHASYSPLSNTRADDLGGSFDNRVTLLTSVVRRVRSHIPDSMPLLVRLSTIDWHERGWSIDDSIELARRLKREGVDLIDCSSGGAVAGLKIHAKPGYQVGFAGAIRRGAGIATAAVGMIDTPEQAKQIVEQGDADVVLLGRAALRDPHWPMHAAKTLGVAPPTPPKQYLRAW